ncbi:hypothetical protein FRC12_005588 [Ceratobasidium sp. 428]|nr:hypothetical protein FRC12_005588 [Ceratobasidium sp. 428]
MAIGAIHLEKFIQDFVNEVRAIAPVQHPNVLRFLGFVNQDNENIGLVYPWMQNNNLNSYLVLHPDADRCQLCVEVAEGIVYLHSMGIIHGDLRARNVLISDGGVAKITGFGSSVLERDIPERHRFFQFAPRWAAPERMFEDERSWPNESQFASRTQLAEKFVDSTRPWVPSWPTTKSDVWSLALV